MLALAVLFGLCGVAAAQKENGEARGGLEQVEAANVVSLDGETTTRRVCLNGGLHVLAAHIIEESLVAFTTIYREGEEHLPASTYVILDPVEDSEADKWGWSSFSVGEPGCFELAVANARRVSTRCSCPWSGKSVII